MLVEYPYRPAPCWFFTPSQTTTVLNGHCSMLQRLGLDSSKASLSMDRFGDPLLNSTLRVLMGPLLLAVM